MRESMSQRTREYITGWYDYKALKEEGMLQSVDEETLLKNKTELYKRGWDEAKASNRKNKSK